MLLSRQAETISELLVIPDSSWMIGNTFTILSLPVPHPSLNADGECEGWGIIKKISLTSV